MPRPVSPRMVMGVLSDIWQTAADKVGKIRVIDDPKIQGACFDLPVDVAKELLTKPLDSENIIEAIKQVHYSAKLNSFFVLGTETSAQTFGGGGMSLTSFT